MTSNTKIRMALTYSNTTLRKLAENLGLTPGSVCVKLQRNSFTQEDMEKYANAIGAKYVCYIEFPDGTRIE